MRKHDEINGYRKEFVYEQYSRIVSDCKDYDKITKTKMLDAIYDVYRNCDNIFDFVYDAGIEIFEIDYKCFF